MNPMITLRTLAYDTKLIRVLILPNPVEMLNTWIPILKERKSKIAPVTVLTDNDTGYPFGKSIKRFVYKVLVSKDVPCEFNSEWCRDYLEVSKGQHELIQRAFSEHGSELLDMDVTDTGSIVTPRYSMSLIPYTVRHLATLRSAPHLLLADFPEPERPTKLSVAISEKPQAFLNFQDQYYLMKYVTRNPEIYVDWLNVCGLATKQGAADLLASIKRSDDALVDFVKANWP